MFEKTLTKTNSGFKIINVIKQKNRAKLECAATQKPDGSKE